MMEGKLNKLLEYYLTHYYPDPKSLEASHKWLTQQLTERIGPFPFRAVARADSRQGLQLGPKVNAILGHKSGISFDVIASDNEPNTSFYALVRSEWTNYLDTLSMADMLTKGLIKVGILRREHSSETTYQFFQRFRSATGMNSHPNRVARDGLKLYHLSDAAQSGIFSDLSLEDELIHRCYRLLSPLNVVPYPNTSPGASKNRTIERVSYIHPITGELGETEPGKLMFAGVLHHYLQESGFGRLTDEWFRWAKPALSKNDIKSGYLMACNTHVHLLKAGASPKRAHLEDVPSAPAVARSVSSSSNENIFVVSESYQTPGRWHLSHFGFSVGGRDRNTPFRFVVKDRHGKNIAESSPVTAAGLGIAERGRRDYDEDNFHQSDFFRDGRPASAIALRVPWRWLVYPLKRADSF